MEYGAYALQSLCNGRVSVHPSVRLSVPSIDMCRLPQPGRGQQISIDSCRCPSCGCGRRHVESRGSRLNTNLLFAAMSTERKQRPSASSRVAEYCDERVCVSVSVCLSASISPEPRHQVCFMDRCRSRAASRYVMYFRFADDVTLLYSGRYGDMSRPQYGQQRRCNVVNGLTPLVRRIRCVLF